MLQRLAARYTWRRRLAGAVLVGSALALGAAFAGRLGDDAVTRAIGGAASALIALTAAASTAIRRIDASAVARHLDRRDPALEESAELLLAHPDALSLTDRLERQRAARAFAARPVPLAHLPDRTASLLALSAAGLLTAAAGLTLMPGTRPGDLGEPGARVPPSVGPARVRSVSILITPPAYTGRPVRQQRVWDVDVEAGARIEWMVQFDRTVPMVAIVTAAGDTTRLEPRGEAHVGSAIARRSVLYQVDAGPAPSDYHRITVHADGAPSVTVLRPAPRTELAPGGSRRIPVEVLARDDYGIADIAIIATVTTGEGEGVRFREQRLALGPGAGVPSGVVYRRTLDLDSLGMAPGDELYFHALAHDARRPGPNEGRSETVFISLRDTAAVQLGVVSRIALSSLPEYFRSQRQIILDTERLIADAPKLPVEVFRERANAIGMDQGLLRLRYGAFTGEDFEAEADPAITHEHDSEENATLLAPSTKATLKGAIAEMWQAELRLRTYRAREALPYEYRALELLKVVQQSSRAYVQRVGFEPPPLEPDRKRLTGRLGGIPSRTVTDSVHAPPPQPEMLAALSRVRAITEGGIARSSDAGLLADAAAAIARLPVSDDERQLGAIRALRTLADSIKAGRRCGPCAVAAEYALASHLSDPVATPVGRAPTAGLARRYLDLLDDSP